MGALRDQMIKDMQIRRFAELTQRSYLREVKALARHYHQAPNQIDERKLQDYVPFLLTERKLAWSSVNVTTAALRFFYTETVDRRDLALTIPPRKTPRRLPEILSAQELERLFEIRQEEFPISFSGDPDLLNGVACL